MNNVENPQVFQEKNNSSKDQFSQKQVFPKNSSKLVLIIFLLIAVIVVLSIVLFFSLNQSKKNEPYPTNPTTFLTPTTLPSTNLVQKSSSFLLRGLNDIPLDNIQLANFPNSDNIVEVLPYDNKIWFSGSGSLMEFDPVFKEITRFSDPIKANCDSNFVIIRNYLFAPCRMLEDLKEINTHNHPVYGIYKINLNTDKVEYIFTNKDGLLSQENYRVYSDDNYIWVATFEGAAKIDTDTNKVEFFQSDLGIKGGDDGIKFSINTILPDKDYVWVVVNASAYSKGGLALFDKKTNKWKSFGPEELRDDGYYSRIDLEYNFNSTAIKKIPGGIQIGFRENSSANNIHDTLVEKQYLYDTGKWKRINSMLIVGANNNNARDYLAKNYPPIGEFGKKDKNGLTQLYLSEDNNPKYIINGRSFLSLSNTISNKKYLITSSSLDVFNSSLKLPKSLFLFNRLIDPYQLSGIKVYVTDKSDILLMINSGYEVSMMGGEGTWYPLEIWAIDTKTDKILKEFKSEEKYAWRRNINLLPVKEGDEIFLTKSTGEKIISYNTIRNLFEILNTKISE